jgi:hypothetical protein
VLDLGLDLTHPTVLASGLGILAVIPFDLTIGIPVFHASSTARA